MAVQGSQDSAVEYVQLSLAVTSAGQIGGPL
jgi:hypothetical protein